MEPARGERCPSGQRRGPAAPEEDNLPSPGQSSFHTSTTPTIRGRNRRSPGSIPPLRVWKPQPNWLVADWLRLMEPARGESCPSCLRRRLTAPGEDNFPSPVQKSFRTSTTPTIWGRKRRSPGSIPPRRVWEPQPNWLVANWLRLIEPARGESCPSGQRRRPAAPGEANLPSPGLKSFLISTAPTTRGRNSDHPERYRPAGWGNPNPTG